MHEFVFKKDMEDYSVSNGAFRRDAISFSSFYKHSNHQSFAVLDTVNELNIQLFYALSETLDKESRVWGGVGLSFFTNVLAKKQESKRVKLFGTSGSWKKFILLFMGYSSMGNAFKGDSLPLIPSNLLLLCKLQQKACFSATCWQ